MLATIVCPPADHSATPRLARMIGALTGLAIAVSVPPETASTASAPPRPANDEGAGATGPRVSDPDSCPLARSPNGHEIVIVLEEMGTLTGAAAPSGATK